MVQKLVLPDNYEVYCFDYFDTVACRNVEPEYVKKLWCKEMTGFFCTEINAERMYEYRHAFEAELCRMNQRHGKDLEFQYQELAEKMYRVIFPEREDLNMAGEQPYADGMFDEVHMRPTLAEFVKKAEDIELNIECRVQKLCEDVLCEMIRLKSLGKTILCISDFYASAGFFEKMFAYHNIEGLFDGVYISSEYLRTKHSGRLYGHVLREYGGRPERFLMIGDNPYSDKKMAADWGIAGYLLDRSRQKEYYRRFQARHAGRGYLKTCLNQIYKGCSRPDYEDITFSLYGFIHKLYAVLQQRNIKDVFFLSREGQFLKKLFDVYQKRRIRRKELMIQSHYLVVSRKSTYMASLKPIQEEQFEIIFRQYADISIYDFLSSLGFALDVQKEIGRRIGADIYEKRTDLKQTDVYAAMMADPCFLEQYESRRIQQKENFAEYLDSYGIDFKKDGLCLVDVGWKGTIQDNIFTFFEERIDVLGLYIGLVNNGKIHAKNKKEGLLFTNIPKPSRYFYVYDENRSIFEVILAASHGSADSYQKTEHGIAAETLWKDKEKKLFQKMAAPMQDHIFQCFKRIDAVLVRHCFEERELMHAAAGYHARMVFLPTRQQMELFYRIYHYENFGVFEFTVFEKAGKVSCMERCKNIARILKYRRAFFQSGYWGVTALKNAGLEYLARPYGWYMYVKYYWNIFKYS